MPQQPLVGRGFNFGGLVITHRYTFGRTPLDG